MIKNLIFQMVICHIVVLIVGMNQWKEGMWLITDILPVSQLYVKLWYIENTSGFKTDREPVVHSR